MISKERMIKKMNRKRLRTKILVALLVVVAIIQAVCILHLKATLDYERDSLQLMRENIWLREETMRALNLYHDKSQELCELRISMGKVYQVAFTNLAEEVGLTKNKGRGTAAVLLKEFGGMGGSEP